MEIWKDIEDFEGMYQVSNLGRIKSYRRGKAKILNTTRLTVEYPMVDLRRKDGTAKTCRIHRLVAIAFLDHIEGKDMVNHINGLKHDNRVENLEWCTNQENVSHAIKTGLLIYSNRTSRKGIRKGKYKTWHNEANERKCKKCSITKPIDDFYTKAKVYHYGKCKECMNAVTKAYRESNHLKEGPKRLRASI